MNKNFKNLGLVALVGAALGGCAVAPGNNVVIKSGTAGEINQQAVYALSSAAADKLCGTDDVLSNYKISTPGKSVIVTNVDGTTTKTLGEPSITYDTEKCLEEKIDSGMKLFTGKIETVKRLIDYNISSGGKLGTTIPTPSMWNRAGTTDTSRYSVAMNVAAEIPSDIVMGSLLKMNQYGTDDLIAKNWARDIKNDLKSTAFLTAIISVYSASNANSGAACQSLGAGSSTSTIGDSTTIGSLGSSTSSGTVGVGQVVIDLLPGKGC